MEYENVIYEVDDRLARITLNRPEKRNALNWPLFRDLSMALKEAERDSNVRVIIITGAGNAFSSGADLESMGDLPEGFEPERHDRRGNESYHGSTNTQSECGKSIEHSYDF